jgi:hypothetical protein
VRGISIPALCRLTAAASDKQNKSARFDAAAERRDNNSLEMTPRQHLSQDDSCDYIEGCSRGASQFGRYAARQKQHETMNVSGCFSEAG